MHETLFSLCFLTRKSVALEIVQATDTIFQKAWADKACLEDKQHLESLPVIKFASLSSLLKKRVFEFSTQQLEQETLVS